MADVRIAAAARRKLFQIYDFSRDEFGQSQADEYFDGLERTFALLADFPRIGTPADDLLVGLRRFRFKSHIIFYTEAADHIVVRQILHVRQGPQADSFT